MTDIVPTLGLFAAAAFRLMPSVNRVLAGLQTLRYNGPVVNALHAELSAAEPGSIRRPSGGDQTGDMLISKNELCATEIR